MRTTHFAAFAALAFTMTAYAQKTGYNYAQQTDFTKYKTYKWVDMKGGPDKLDDINRGNVQKAIETELAAKGLQKTDSDSADLMIGYQVGFSENQEYTTFNSGGPWGRGPGWGGGWGWGYGGGGISQTTEQKILVGTLVLDMYDRSAKQLVWQGRVSDTINPTEKPEKRLKKIDKAMNKLLKNYPPKVKS